MGDDGGEYEVQELDPRVMLVPEFLPGERVTITIGSSTKQAEVRFVGPLQGMKGFFLGVQYDDKVGKNDGQVHSRGVTKGSRQHANTSGSTKPSGVPPKRRPKRGRTRRLGPSSEVWRRPSRMYDDH